MKRGIIIGTYSERQTRQECEEQLFELKSLMCTYGIETILSFACSIKQFDPKTFIGKGKVEEIGVQAVEQNCDVLVFDDEISPQQQRNLEKIWGKAVIDRTELILGIFAQRAQTREAKIQIELASLRYQQPRLRRLWTHLSRQRTGGSGGGGFLKGEGEKQIEIDRRIIKRQIDRLQQELKEVIQHRATQRRARERKAIPSFAIIGYTNAGKSSLMNALTAADVLVEDKLFATLDTTTRQYTLPNQQKILLIDTVGFIRKIPHLLVAAFKSTLEEAVQADILIHLIDASNMQAPEQAEATLQVLKELGAQKRPMITVLNKIDQFKNPMMIHRMKFKYPKTVAISAKTKEGLPLLLEAMVREIQQLRKKVHLRIPQSHFSLVSEVMREGKVISSVYEENDVVLEVEIPHYLERKVSLFAVSNP